MWGEVASSRQSIFFFFFQLMWVSIYNTSKGTEVKERSHHLCAPSSLCPTSANIFIFFPHLFPMWCIFCVWNCVLVLCGLRDCHCTYYDLSGVLYVLVIVIRSPIAWLRAVSLRWHSVFVVILSLKHRDRKVGSFHWLNAFIGTILWGEKIK